MKQMGLALQQYTQDYDEKMPIQTYALTYMFMDATAGWYNSSRPGATSNWLAELYPYTKSIDVFVCPSSQPNVNQSGCSADCIAPTATSKTSYFGNAVVIMNQYDQNGVDLGLTVKSRHLSIFPRPAEIAFAQEGLGSYNVALMYPRLESGGAGIRYHRWHQYSGGQESFSNRHFDGGNLIFCDGHAKWRKYAGLKDDYFGLTFPRGGDVWNTSTPIPADCTTNF